MKRLARYHGSLGPDRLIASAQLDLDGMYSQARSKEQTLNVRRHFGQVGVVAPAPNQTHETGDVVNEPYSASPAELVGPRREGVHHHKQFQLSDLAVARSPHVVDL